MDIVAVNFTPVERKAYELNVPKAGSTSLYLTVTMRNMAVMARWKLLL